jgi:glutaminase
LKSGFILYPFGCIFVATIVFRFNCYRFLKSLQGKSNQQRRERDDVELSDDCVVQILQEIGAIRQTVGEVKQKVEDTYEQACKTNGSVADLSKRVLVLESDKCKESGKTELKSKFYEYVKYVIMAFLGGSIAWVFSLFKKG